MPHDEPVQDKPEPKRPPDGALTEAELSDVSGGSPTPPNIVERIPSPPEV